MKLLMLVNQPRKWTLSGVISVGVFATLNGMTFHISNPKLAWYMPNLYPKWHIHPNPIQNGYPLCQNSWKSTSNSGLWHSNITKIGESGPSLQKRRWTLWVVPKQHYKIVEFSSISPWKERSTLQVVSLRDPPHTVLLYLNADFYFIFSTD